MHRETVTILLAIASFVLSLYTLWLTQLRQGRLRMTQPTLICLKREGRVAMPKVFLRTLLFTTASKGRVVENMYVRLHAPIGTFLFNFWGHTDAGKLTLGSGLFVGQQGVVCDHHFDPPHNPGLFLFQDGEYRMEVYAATVGRKLPWKLMDVTFRLNTEQAAELIQILDRELFLYWNSETRTYDVRVERPSGRSRE